MPRHGEAGAKRHGEAGAKRHGEAGAKRHGEAGAKRHRRYGDHAPPLHYLYRTLPSHEALGLLQALVSSGELAIVDGVAAVGHDCAPWERYDVAALADVLNVVEPDAVATLN